MILQKLHLHTKPFSTKSVIWRNEIKQSELANQISSILLQRKNWAPLVSSFKLSSTLTESLFHSIILKTQSNPQISLSFFNWVKSTFNFNPKSVKSSLSILMMMIQISSASSSTSSKPAAVAAAAALPILDSLIQTLPVSTLVASIIASCSRTNESHSNIVLSFLVEGYARKGACLDALKVFDEMRLHHLLLTLQSSNALLDAFHQQNEIPSAWCFLGSVIRNGVSPDSFTWSIVARILSKENKLERLVTLFDSGICCNSALFNLIIDGYCKRGDFEAAFAMLNEDCANKNFSFTTYSSILDGACMYRSVNVIETTIGLMISKKLLDPNSSSTPEYDSVIRRFCDEERTHAATFFFERASDANIALQETTYGCVLRALSIGGRLKEAISLYRKIATKGIILNDNSVCFAFMNLLCKEAHQTEETAELLIEMIGRGFVPPAPELSNLFNLHCKTRKWRYAEALLNAVLEKDYCLPVNCSSLVRRYCSTGKLELAMALHNKVAKTKKGCTLDLESYKVLLSRLFTERKVDEATGVFDYMRNKSLVLDSESYTTMVRGLCGEKEMRKAMNLHDEMMKLKLKPDEATYKRLILGFN